MKKSILALLLTLTFAGSAFAADAPAVTEQAETATEVVAAQTPAQTAAAAVNDAIGAPETAESPAVDAAAVIPAAPEESVDETGENLEFISGEVSSLDEANKMLTVKLYGETENTPGDKSITVSVDDSTDITDGEKDRDLKSLAATTEVDVEYDPATNKATYIFVY